eukprot:TRINITY_DN9633_c0_g1_i1.p1 TRINITY_DN9633_c0_g1~~TRINITY_DN9633_c0_g1_i1.p1  ORF type:complete len:119 (+),score=10.37 TRINITY_DN9633_c0_g1_i1:280-636(+)
MEVDVENLSLEEMKRLRLQCKKKLMPSLSRINDSLALKETPFLVGNKLSFVDLFLFSLVDALQKENINVLDEFPLIGFAHAVILNRPKIRKFCESGRRDPKQPSQPYSKYMLCCAMKL